MKKQVYLLSCLFLLTAGFAACSSHDLYEDPEQPKSHQMESQGENDTTDYSKETIPPVEANAEVKEFFENALKMVDGENDFFYDDKNLHGTECISKCMIVNDQKTLEQLYRGKGKLPNIDFNKTSLIIGLQRFNQESYDIDKIKLISNNEKAQLNLYTQLNSKFNPFYYTNRSYWGLYPKIQASIISVNVIKDSDVQQFTDLPFYDGQVPVKLKELSELPKWLVNSINYYQGNVERAPYVMICQGEYNGETIYLLYNPLNSCVLCDIYDSNGKTLTLSENKFNSTTNWSLIYIVLNHIVL